MWITTALAANSVSLEGVPWWARALLFGVPTTVGALTALVYALRGMRQLDGGKPEAAPEAPPTQVATTNPATGPFTMPLPATAHPPHTVDGQLELARILNERAERERQELLTRLDRAESRLEAAESQVETLQQQLSALAGINGQLRFLLERNGMPVPPLGPPPWAAG